MLTIDSVTEAKASTLTSLTPSNGEGPDIAADGRIHPCQPQYVHWLAAWEMFRFSIHGRAHERTYGLRLCQAFASRPAGSLSGPKMH